jgi:two-component system, NtrC family, sensor kinase
MSLTSGRSSGAATDFRSSDLPSGTGFERPSADVLHVVLERVPAPVVVAEREGLRRIVFVNASFTALAARPRSELVGAPLTRLFEHLDATDDAVLRGPDGSVGKHRFSRSEYEARTTGDFYELWIAAGDVELSDTERDRGTADNKASGLHKLVETLPLGVAIHLRDSVLYLNATARAWLGYGPDDDVRNESLLDLAHREDRSAIEMRMGQVLVEGKAVEPVECRLNLRNGKTILVEMSAIPVVVDGVRAIAAVGQDITARREREVHLRLADRLSSVGRLAASVGHEINNPLTYVLGNLELMQRRLAKGEAGTQADLEAIKHQLRVVREGAERVRDIVRDLRTLSRNEYDQSGPVELHPALDLAASMANHELRHRARLVKEYGKVPPVWGEQARLGQVFLNLLVNAAQALPEGAYDDHEVRLRTYVRDEGSVVVEVSDTGSGISDDAVGRIFEPFFTTKPSGVGTGLGLSICHNIVRSLGGSIQAERGRERGTTFRVVLRTADAAKASATSIPPPSPAQLGRRTVLVIDDEPEIGNYFKQALDGFEVVVARSGREGLEALRKGSIDVVLCDLMMRDLTGMDVHARLAEQMPGMEQHIVFMTGGVFSERARRFIADHAPLVLHKPFSDNEARRAIERKLRRA